MEQIKTIKYIGKTKYHYLGNLIHNDDGPAVVRDDGEEWWVNGLLHRVDEPAVIWNDGHREWWFEGKCHRVGGPAVIRANGEEEFWVEGKPDKWYSSSYGWPNGIKQMGTNGETLVQEEQKYTISQLKSMTLGELVNLLK